MSFWASQAGNFKNLRMLPRQHVQKNHIIDGPACTWLFFHHLKKSRKPVLGKLYNFYKDLTESVQTAKIHVLKCGLQTNCVKNWGSSIDIVQSNCCVRIYFYLISKLRPKILHFFSLMNQFQSHEGHMLNCKKNLIFTLYGFFGHLIHITMW